MGLFEIRVRAVSRIETWTAVGKTSKASTQPPDELLSPRHEAFVQAYITNGMNAVKAYQAAYPRSSGKGRSLERHAADGK
jgi:hypothetical protein